MRRIDSRTTRTASTWFAIALAVLVAVWAYLPGLDGGFLFDDFVNLNAIGAQGRVDDWPAFWRYVTSGTADPTGRPLALLSFLIDANSWPAQPYPFKRTSLMLHLLDGVLLYVLLRQLGGIALSDRGHAARSAALGAAIWLLHPLFVSTTLYVVQREAMLPAMFTLLGLIAYVHGRRRYAEGAVRRGTLLMTTGIAAGTALATLSKGNGILLPMLALVIDATLLAPTLPRTGERSARQLRLLRVALLYAPTMLVVAYLLAAIPGSIDVATRNRPWTLGERVLTEGRMLFQYIALLIVPRPFSTGLFNDNIIVSTSLLTPWTTLPALVGAVALPLGAWCLRRRFPIAAAAVLFFFAGHLLESTVIALELYFEHRNYLPAMLLFWPIAVALTGAGRWPAARALASAGLIAALALMTHARATLWGNSAEQAIVWAALSPDSPRAQASAAQHEIAAGRAEAAASRLSAALAQHPGELQLALNLIGARCQLGGVDASDIDAVATALRSARHGLQMTFNWLDSMVAPIAGGTCRGLGLADLESLIRTAQANTRLNNSPGRAQELEHILGRIALLRGEPARGLEHFDAALDIERRPVVAFKQAALLGSAGYPREGLAHLDHYTASTATGPKPPAGMPSVHAWILARQGYWATEYALLRDTLEEDARRADKAPSPDSTL